MSGDDFRITPRLTTRLLFAGLAGGFTFLIGLAAEDLRGAAIAALTIASIGAVAVVMLEANAQHAENKRLSPDASGVGRTPRSTAPTTEIAEGVFVTIVATPSGVAFEIEDQRESTLGRFVGTTMSDAASAKLAASLATAINERARTPWGVQR